MQPSVAAMKIAVQTSTTGRRPNRSEIGPIASWITAVTAR